MSAYRFLDDDFHHFDQNFVSTSTAQLETLPTKIETWEKLLKPNVDKLTELNKSLAAVQKQLTPLNEAITKIDANMTVAATGQVIDIIGHVAQIATTKSANTTALHVGSDITAGTALLGLATKRYQLKKEREPLLRQSKELEKMIDACQKNVTEAKSAIFDLQQQTTNIKESIEEAKAFLLILKTNPIFLFDKIVNELLKNLLAYDDSHIFGFSKYTQLLSFDLQDKIKKLQNNKQQNATEAYAQLCGLLWDFFGRINEESQLIDPDFAKILMQSLANAHIAKDKSLPNDSNDKSESVYVTYKNIQKLNLAYHNLTLENFKHIQEEEYINAKNALRVAIDVHKEDPLYHTLTQHAEHLLNLVENEKHKAKANIDMHYYAGIFNTTKKILDRPHDISEWQNQYLALAKHHAVGQPSLKFKIGGAILGVVGAALVVGCTFAVLASFGVLSAPAILGIAIGVSVCAKALTLAAGGVALGAVASGVGLFAHGCQRGVPKTMENLVNSAKKMNGDSEIVHHASVGDLMTIT